MKKYYAIGTVVKVRSKDNNNQEIEIKVMIIGRRFEIEGIGERDYLGLSYPYGYYDSKSLITFNEEAIIDILHKGYVDDSEFELNAMLSVEKEMNKVGMLEE